MGEEQKALWKITYKDGYHMGNLYFNCLEDQIKFMFEQIVIESFALPVELFNYELIGEVIDYEQYNTATK